ncbi:MAG: fimbrial protein, partial [Pseudomonas sp.]
AGTLVPNTLSLRLDPVDTPIDATHGVLSLSAGADPATGVGLQVLDASGAPWALSQNQLLSLPLAAGTTALNIPLSARYLQTAATVTAGSANAVATYTIIYQ